MPVKRLLIGLTGAALCCSGLLAAGATGPGARVQIGRGVASGGRLIPVGPGTRLPRPRSNTGTQTGSTNWSGYAQTPPLGTSYRAIKGKFRVPTVTTGPGKQYSSDWVGIGGFNTGDLVQDGIEADNLNGTAHYNAWTEILPAPEVPLSLTVHPGDLINAIVKETAAGTWVMKVKDLTTGASGSRTVTYVSSHTSAEVVHERPTVCNPTCGLAKLARTTNPVFDPASYSTAPPGAPSWHNFFQTPAGATLNDIAMVNDAQTAVIATPSDADADHDGFQVADGNTQPPPPSS
jgi:hypothetical protein